jgi:N-acetylneuraminic acid mutarotase
MLKYKSLFGLLLSIALLCSAETSVAEDGLGEWRFTASMNIERAEFPAVVCGDHIYVFGGHPLWASEPYSSVERARINPDGTLGQWTVEAETLVVPVYGAAAICRDSIIYLVSGAAHPYQPTTAVQYTRVGSDGALAPWSQTSSINQQRANLAATEYDGYLYALGGNPSKAVNSVEFAEINPDGSLGAWSFTSSNLVGRWLPSAAAHNGYLYVVGGFAGGPTASVEYAAINLDGSLGDWQFTESMTVPRSGAPGVVVLGGFLYAMAGDNYSSDLHNSVELATISQDGSLGSWNLLPDTLAVPMNHTACALKDNHVFLAGGFDSNGNSSDDVQVSSFRFGYVCGDVDCSGAANITDAVYLIQYIFAGGPAPCAECP